MYILVQYMSPLEVKQSSNLSPNMRPTILTRRSVQGTVQVRKPVIRYPFTQADNLSDFDPNFLKLPILPIDQRQCRLCKSEEHTFQFSNETARIAREIRACDCHRWKVRAPQKKKTS